MERPHQACDERWVEAPHAAVGETCPNASMLPIPSQSPLPPLLFAIALSSTTYYRREIGLRPNER